jgi:hypothetical protein
MDQRTFLVDVSITHPSNPSNRIHGQRMLGAAAFREQAKVAKYVEHAKSVHAVFVPFVAESYGGLGKKAREFLRTMAVYAHEHAITLDANELMRDLRHAIGCVVQRGNALIMHAGRVKSAHANYPSF